MPNRVQQTYGDIYLEPTTGVLVIDLNHRVQWVSPDFCNMLGYEAFELIGRALEEITHPEDALLDAQLAERIIQGSMPSYEFKKRYITKSGATMAVYLSASVIRDRSGKPIYFQTVVEPQFQMRSLNFGKTAPNAESADMDRIRKAILM